MSYSPYATKTGQKFQLERLLKQRGLSLKSEMKIENTLFSFFNDQSQISENDFFELMANQEERKKIRKSIYSASTTYKYKGSQLNLNATQELAFTKSFEWCVAKLLEDEFDFFTTGSGIILDQTPAGMDFDVLGFGLDLFVHVECKSGNPNNLTNSEVESFKEKSKFLGADINIFYVDYNGLNYEDHFFLKLFPKVFSDTQNELYKISKPDSGFQIYQVGIAPIFIIDTHKSSRDPINNFKEIFYLYFQMRSYEKKSSGYSPEIFSNYGYDVSTLT